MSQQVLQGVGQARAHELEHGVGDANGVGIYLPGQQHQAQQLVELPAEGFDDGAREAHAGGRVQLVGNLLFLLGERLGGLHLALAKVAVLDGSNWLRAGGLGLPQPRPDFG